MIDREDDRARLRELLLDRGHRLVVVAGPGGIGKTRLAVQIATELAPRYRHGARLLPLASITPGADLDAVVARHLGLRDTRNASYRDGIARHLASREMLIVVDNGESAPGIADVLTFIHARCPAVTLLVTSRHTLDVYGEVVHQLLPLPHHAPGAPALAAGIGIGSLRHSPTVQLLRDRVRAIDPSFEVTAANATDIATICERLGGLPLAIELVAPPLAQRDPATLLAEMRATGAPPGRAAAALRLSVRLSYRQLSPERQRIFRTLCIMRGQWLLDDVLPILPDGDEPDAIDHLDALVRGSLLTSIATGDEIRSTINPVLRHVGQQMLDELGETSDIASRHAGRMLQIAEEAEPRLTGPEQRWWLDRLEHLHDDMLAAHTWLLDHDRPADALRLAAALWRFGYARGHYREIRRIIESALARAGGPDPLRAHAHNGIGLLATMLRDHVAARAAFRQALALAEPLGLDREIAVARVGLAELDATCAGAFDAALDHLQRAEAIYARLRDPRGIATVLTNRGCVAWLQDRLDEAFAIHEEAGTRYAEARDPRGVAWSRMYTGRIAARQGRHHEAVTRLLAALDGYVAVGDAAGIADVLEPLAGVALATGDRERASVLLGAAAAIRAGAGSTPTGRELVERDATLAAVSNAPGHEAAHARGMALAIDEAVALARGVPMPPRPRDAAAMRTRARERFGITPREHEVLVLLAEGLTDQEAADRLSLSVRTVHTHTASLMRKLDVHSRAAAARAAHRAGILR